MQPEMKQVTVNYLAMTMAIVCPNHLWIGDAIMPFKLYRYKSTTTYARMDKGMVAGSTALKRH